MLGILPVLSESQASTMIRWVASLLLIRSYYPAEAFCNGLERWVVFSPPPYEDHTIQFYGYGEDIPFTAKITHYL